MLIQEFRQLRKVVEESLRVDLAKVFALLGWQFCTEFRHEVGGEWRVNAQSFETMGTVKHLPILFFRVDFEIILPPSMRRFFANCTQKSVADEKYIG